MMYIRAISNIVVFLLVSCAGGAVKQDASRYYKRDMGIVYGATSSRGVRVLPHGRAEYPLTFLPGEMDADRVNFITCNRSWTREVSAWVDGRGFDFNYSPLPIERERYCPLEVEVLSPSGSSFAFLDVANDRFVMPYTLDCNGERQNVIGVSICQAHEGLSQRIEAPVRVVVSGGTKECDEALKVSGWSEIFIIAQKGTCVYSIMEVDKPNREGRITVLGYDADMGSED